MYWPTDFNQNVTNLISVANQFYCEPHRKYHTIDHIRNMINSIINHDIVESISLSQLVAVIFHDAIYIPGSTDNELNSAKIMAKTLNTIDNNVILAAHNIILDTEYHSPKKDLRSALVIDLDLEILAAPYQLFREARILIRDEYKHLTDEEWEIGSTKFLLEMLNRRYIFCTNKFRELYEDRARENIVKELRYIAGE